MKQRAKVIHWGRGMGAVVAAAGMVAAWSIPATATTRHASSSSFKVAYMVPGDLGDLGFFDSGEKGITWAHQQLGATVKTVQGTTDTSQWTPDLKALSGKGYNVIVTGSTQVAQDLAAVAKEFPSQHYIFFDGDVPAPNIASIVYLQNDGAFLAGVLSGLVTTDTKQFPLAKGSDVVGIVGGENIPVIRDFVVGFVKGAKVVNPKIKVLTSYVGSFTDPQTGYNQAVEMYNQGADVIFAAAGSSGLGVLKASAKMNRYSIGVDSDQNGLYPKNVLASDLKNVDVSVLDLLKKAKAGTLKYNHQYVYGLTNNGVELLLNYKLVPSSVAAKLNSYTREVAAGKISVPCVSPYCLSPTK
jgi:basic membrane protein A